MKKKQIIQSICTILIIIIALLSVSSLLKVKDSDVEYATFYKYGADIDVLFYGSSIVHYGIYPMELWNEYGITSYNMGNNSERLYMTYYTMKNSLDYANPETVVVDLSGLGWAGQRIDGTLKDHGFLDSVPLSWDKLKSIYEIFDENNRLEYIFPSVVYHSRWEELNESDLKVKKSYTYGADILTNKIQLKKPGQERYDESRDGNFDLEEEALLKMKQLCENRNIQFILIFMPFEVRGGDQKLREYAQSFAKKNDIMYFDLQDCDVVNWESGFSDESHMNYEGAKPFTKYLGKLLKDEVKLGNHQGELGYENWNTDYIEYQEYCHQLGVE